ncbi:ABC transporter ATP-binding protein [Domibacillus enclensis]|uniref:Quaternary amine transport ATP-binding protein n=1 Tax=Domibacillus enclensis TaxID=1017273 RepID=A0A1N7B270_9BACI|nr:betaine/proline/choline family ABC transporter ATP-binding protein [Domibacillus enclensis]OXS75159.1 glycine/betaine ABC transporter ATP-binding protein [Domibacillus enclensis]SIR45449.1 osmoprotectant transport system ATP-binding protein [Domibacillus enclensis]
MIEFNEVSKKYPDGFEALKKINLKVEAGELFVLIGPSGCGKTTTMKMINRLIDPSSGTITIDGKNISKINPVQLRRDIGYVIQQIGLMPHMTIKENVGLVPKLKKWEETKYSEKVTELMHLVGLDPAVFGDRYPSELSGGQQQRIGVIRAMAAEPNIILMDEPFSALDPISREQLQDELVRLQSEIKKTIVFVTHDMDEALKIADRICIMQGGEVVQLDTPERILRHPANDFVRQFIGEDRMQQDTMSLPALELLMTSPVTASPERGIAAALKLMRQKRVDSLIIVDNQRQYHGVVGIWDLQKYYSNEDMTLRDIEKVQVPVMNHLDDPETALDMINQSPLSFIVVTDEQNRVQGMINRASIVRHISNQFA